MEKLSVLKIKAKNGECMHMKYKSIIIIEWNDLPIIKFTSTIWRPSCGEFVSPFLYIKTRRFSTIVVVVP